ncbi:MAG: pyridoxine 5'-phosphate synthase [Bacteroidales bacterium]|nr:pyridoxine 5'-phosphate synthase [Candidatus Sodaliphilus fimicaballi]
MTNLSVNINKIATLRNARGGNVPCVENVALDCERYGADGITVHPRPDERHIRRDDVMTLRPLLRREFNIEGYPSEDFLQMVLLVKPTQVTLVPDAPNALTSSAGWDVTAHFDFLTQVVDRLKEAGIRTSIFVGTDEENIRQAARTGTDRVELYTGPYAEQYKDDPEAAIAPYVAAAQAARNMGIGVNAGHDLNLDNLKFFKEHIPFLMEVSIGHQLISDSLYMGLEQAIKAYKQCLK